MKKYFLIAQNKSRKDFKVIGLEQENGYKRDCNSLEDIDNYTMLFANQEELIDTLKKDSLIPDADDIFIVSMIKGQKELRFRDVVYNKHNINNLARINAEYRAYCNEPEKNHKNEYLNIFTNDTKKLFAQFIDKTNKQEFKEMVLYTNNNIPTDVKRAISNRGANNLVYSVFPKYYESYNTVRDIIELEVAYIIYRNHIKYNEEHYNRVNPFRIKLKRKLIDLFNKDSVVDQFDLFQDGFIEEPDKGRN